MASMRDRFDVKHYGWANRYVGRTWTEGLVGFLPFRVMLVATLEKKKNAIGSSVVANCRAQNVTRK